MKTLTRKVRTIGSYLMLLWVLQEAVRGIMEMFAELVVYFAFKEKKRRS